MILLVGAALAVLSIAVVVYPFLKTSRRDQPPSQSHEEAHRPAELDSVYEAIHTLQLEYQLGKVPEAVYQEQLRAYRLQGAVTLRQSARQAQEASFRQVHDVSSSEAPEDSDQ